MWPRRVGRYNLPRCLFLETIIAIIATVIKRLQTVACSLEMSLSNGNKFDISRMFTKWAFIKSGPSSITYNIYHITPKKTTWNLKLASLLGTSC